MIIRVLFKLHTVTTYTSYINYTNALASGRRNIKFISNNQTPSVYRSLVTTDRGVSASDIQSGDY